MKKGLAPQREQCPRCQGKGYTVITAQESEDRYGWMYGCPMCGGKGKKFYGADSIKFDSLDFPFDLERPSTPVGYDPEKNNFSKGSGLVANLK